MKRPRIALFSPVRPIPSGVSDYTEELLPRLAADLAIDLFIDGYRPDNEDLKKYAGCRLADDFPDLHEHTPYDLAVYHLGNSPHHNYILRHLYSVPGLVVLHDLSLNSTRLRTALESWTGEQYRAEMEVSYGETGTVAAEIALSGLHNRLLLRLFPLCELPIRANVMTVVHEEWAAERMREAVPGAEVRTVPMGVEQKSMAVEAALAVRERRGIPAGAFVVGTFGLLAPEKRISELLSAFRWLSERRPDAHCLLVGDRGDDLPVEELIAELGLGGRAIVTGRLPMDDFLAHMAACDVVVFLRWPTQRETSSALLRALALGIPAVVSDLAHLLDFPDDAVVKVPVVGEERHLRRALLELAESEPRRRRFGEAAARHFRARHSWDIVRTRWLEVIGEAIELSTGHTIDRSLLPEHLRF
jgi:glycosyltransferase involved in cell wall biosynthesis